MDWKSIWDLDLKKSKGRSLFKLPVPSVYLYFDSPWVGPRFSIGSSPVPEIGRNMQIFFCSSANNTDIPVMEYKMISLSFVALSSPFCANYPLQGTVAVPREPAESTIMYGITGKFLFWQRPRSLGRGQNGQSKAGWVEEAVKIWRFLS